MAFTRPPVTAADGTFSIDGAAAWAAGFGVAGATSGGIPFFSSATSEGSSALLASGGVVLGGGAGAAPFTDTGLTSTGTGATFVLTAGGGFTATAGNLTASAGAILTANGTTVNLIGATTSSYALVVTQGGGGAGCSVIKLKSLATDSYSGMDIFDSANAQQWAMGYGGSTVGGNLQGRAFFYSPNASGMGFFSSGLVEQFTVLPTASASRRITVTGSNGGNPTISTSAGSLAITPAVVMASGYSHASAEIDLSYSYNTPATGATITTAAGEQRTIVNPAGTIATLTITTPPSPVEGQMWGAASSQIVTTLTITGTAGATVVAPPASMAVDSNFRMIYRAAITSWLPAP